MWRFTKRDAPPALAGQFARECATVFDEALLAERFHRTKEWTCEAGVTVTYRNGGRYIQVSFSTDFRDGPPHCDMDLGEGSDEWIETDWNKIGLRQLMPKPLAASEIESFPYAIGKWGGIPNTLGQLRSDLFKHAVDFLAGDLDRFHARRREITRLRQPYRIGRPGLLGYKWTDDPESAAMKERYSK